MSEAAALPSPVTPERPSPRRRIVKIVAWVVGLAAAARRAEPDRRRRLGLARRSSGTPSRRSRSATSSSAASSSACRRCCTALGWYGILRYAYPGGVTFMPVLASYATGVALNNFLPANIGTFVMLLMYVAIVQGATFPGRPRRLRRPEDLLPGHRDADLRLPLPRDRGLVRVPVRRRQGPLDEPPGARADHHRRRDPPDRDPAAGSSGAGSRRCGPRRRRAPRSSATCAPT